MKKTSLIILALIMVNIDRIHAQQATYDVTAGNGNGLRFWQSDNYKIHMGNTSEYKYGAVSDYSIKMNMNNDPARGWTWGVAGATPVASLNTLGQFQIAGSFITGGNIILPSNGGNKQIYTWDASDANWRIGMSDSPGFTRSLATSHVQYLTYAAGTGQGFAVGVNNGLSSFEVNGTNHTAFFRGSVGINTTTPGGKLDINHAGGQLRLSGGTVAGGVWTSTTDQLYLADWSTGVKGININMTTGVVNVGGNGSATSGYGSQLGFLGTSENSDPLWISRYNNGSNNSELRLNIGDDNGQPEDRFVVGTQHWQGGWFPHLAVQASGYVGIGTSTPSYKLQVAGGAIALDEDQPLRGGGRWLISGNSSMVTVGTANPGIALRFDAGATNRMFIDGTSGNVGIGTTSPNQKLTVNGTVYGKEIKVDLSVPGPDYVFERDYNLLSLEEIEKYIHQYKHLPEVSSAKEMEAEGINVGEMNMILLKKVEELTLYLIEKDKEIKELHSLLKEIKNQK